MFCFSIFALYNTFQATLIVAARFDSAITESGVAITYSVVAITDSDVAITDSVVAITDGVVAITDSIFAITDSVVTINDSFVAIKPTVRLDNLTFQGQCSVFSAEIKVMSQ